MSRPLIADPKRTNEAAVFHRECFAEHGNRCYDCSGHATDAAHIIPRSALGRYTRYAVPRKNSRPKCRPCHDANKPFPIALRRAAAKAINAYVDRKGLKQSCKVLVP